MFTCAGCDASLTLPVSQVALPAHAHQKHGYELLLVLMERGTYAVNPEPFGPSWQRWEEIGVEEAEARGVYAPGFALSYGPPGAVADIALVPRYPQTGETWPSGTEAAVPLAADVWMYMAFSGNRRLRHTSGELPDGVYGDDPPPPFGPFRLDREVFLHALARLPEVRPALLPTSASVRFLVSAASSAGRRPLRSTATRNRGVRCRALPVRPAAHSEGRVRGKPLRLPVPRPRAESNRPDFSGAIQPLSSNGPVTSPAATRQRSRKAPPTTDDLYVGVNSPV